LKEPSTDAEAKSFLREAALMPPFNHPNVLSLVGVCTAGAPRLIALQFCENGSLLSYLQKHTGYEELQIGSKFHIMEDVAKGMQYLSELNVVHRDLAARNVLITADFVCKVEHWVFLYKKSKPIVLNINTVSDRWLISACRVLWAMMAASMHRQWEWCRFAGRRPKRL
jgi:serine/threonine protein kinase